jgi:hypothetical protein
MRNKELNTIRQIAHENNDHNTSISRNKFSNNKHLTSTYNQQNNNTDNNEALKNTYNANHREQTNLTVEGAYKLQCTGCPMYYIGQRGRTFQERKINTPEQHATAEVHQVMHNVS